MRGGALGDQSCLKMDPGTPAAFLTRSPTIALSHFLAEGSPSKIDYHNKGTLILASLLEDLVEQQPTLSEISVYVAAG